MSTGEGRWSHISKANLTRWTIALALGAIPAAVIVLTPLKHHYSLAARVIGDIGIWLVIAALFRIAIYFLERIFDEAV